MIAVLKLQIVENVMNLDTIGGRCTKILFVSDIMCVNIAIRKVVLLADNGSK